MRQANITVSVREKSGKGSIRSVRASGNVPAVLYGRKTQPMNISINPKPFKQLLQKGAGTNTLFYINIEGASEADKNAKKERVVLLKEIQRHPLSNAWVHIDFHEIALDEPVQVPVPLHFEGKAKGLADGGIVETMRRELHVRCLPKAIPDSITIDISNLGVHDSIHVSDVKVAEGIEIADSPTLTLVTIVLPAKEEAPVVAAAVEGAVPAEGTPEAAAAAAAAGAAPAAGAAAKTDAKAPAADAAKGAKKPEAKK